MKSHKAIKVFSVFSVLLGLILIHFTAQQVGHVEDQNMSLDGHQDLASRSQELGNLSQSGKKKSDYSILLNDPNMNKSWGISNVNAAQGWRVSQGSKKVVVAVIDTGIDIGHPDIKANLWVNPNESKNDRKGFVGDTHGWNFVDNSPDLTDNHGHGTHIAGIIGAVGGNGIGISGVSPKVSLMILKYFDPKSTKNNNLKNTIRAFEYAIEMGADIINYSGGGLAKSPLEEAMIKKARDKGILVVAAAGNESSNSDVRGYYPADYDLENIISVTAIDKKKNILSTSNYGLKTVDIAAPGNDIYSTIPRDKGSYGTMTGTSQATAFVSGVAALIKANNPALKAPQILKYLKHTGDVEPTLAHKTRYSKKINTYRALTILDQGLGVNGIIAENTKSMKDGDFSLDRDIAFADKNIETPTNQISAFGKSLMQHLKVPEQKIVIKNKEKKDSPQL